MRPIEKLKALLESKGIYRQAVRLMREHQRLIEDEEADAEEEKDTKDTKKAKPKDNLPPWLKKDDEDDE